MKAAGKEIMRGGERGESKEWREEIKGGGDKESVGDFYLIGLLHFQKRS